MLNLGSSSYYGYGFVQAVDAIDYSGDDNGGGDGDDGDDDNGGGNGRPGGPGNGRPW